MATWLGLTETQAAQIVEVRRQLGKFQRVDDLLNLVGLEPSVYDEVSDRIILM
jgi:DNA uptake protein ComE-like DNA-binding protein